jgi:hypothetical protein
MSDRRGAAGGWARGRVGARACGGLAMQDGRGAAPRGAWPGQASTAGASRHEAGMAGLGRAGLLRTAPAVQAVQPRGRRCCYALSVRGTTGGQRARQCWVVEKAAGRRPAGEPAGKRALPGAEPGESAHERGARGRLRPGEGERKGRGGLARLRGERCGGRVARARSTRVREGGQPLCRAARGGAGRHKPAAPCAPWGPMGRGLSGSAAAAPRGGHGATGQPAPSFGQERVWGRSGWAGPWGPRARAAGKCGISGASHAGRGLEGGPAGGWGRGRP